jgi:hypothetical protein
LKAARVLSLVAGGRFLVAAEGANWTATVAASCLLAPQVGDLILVYLDQVSSADLIDEPRVYALAVLERDPAKTADLTLPGPVEVKTGPLFLKPQSLAVETTSARIESQELAASGQLLRLDYKVAHFLAGLVTSVCRSLLTRARNLTLWVENSANVSSQTMRLTAQEDLLARAGGVDIKAQASVKIDGRDIRLG